MLFCLSIHPFCKITHILRMNTYKRLYKIPFSLIQIPFLSPL